MASVKKLLLTEEDQRKIKEAVQKAEKNTSGEIVPYIVSQSDAYPIAFWRGVVFFALLGLLLVLCVHLFYEGWGMSWVYTGGGMALWVLVFGALGGLLVEYIPFLKRLFAGYGTMKREVHQRALQAFLSEQIFDTFERTGILLFVSLFEHRIEVLGDKGINAKVKQEDWNDVVKRIRRGVKKNDLAGGLVEAIEMCGSLLDRKEVAIRPDDTNELSDDIRISEG